MFNIHYPNVTGKILPVQKLYYAGTKGYETGYPKRQYTNAGYPFKIVFRRCQTQYWRRNNYFWDLPKDEDLRLPKPKPNVILIDAEKAISAWLKSKYNKYPFHSEYKERYADTRTIFLQKYVDWKYLVENFGDHIITAERPINMTHWTLLTSGEKLIFRKSLFWRKYRYKVGFKSTPELYQTGLPWLCGFFENKTDDEYRFNHNLSRAIYQATPAHLASSGRIRRRYYYYGHNVFINDKEDLVMLKLGINHSIHVIEQCMTYNEVENFEKELEIEN